MAYSKPNHVKLPDLGMSFKQTDPKADMRVCEAKGCNEEGVFPAPRSRSALRDYRYFCLDHVRDYNKRWNYFSGMEGAALEQAIRSAATWERPSWKFGTGGAAPKPDQFDDVFGFFESETRPSSEAILDQLDPEERKAWALFSLDPTASKDQIKQQYNKLVKQHHPDRHGGDPKAEEKLKEINLAYSLLRKKHA